MAGNARLTPRTIVYNAARNTCSPRTQRLYAARAVSAPHVPLSRCVVFNRHLWGRVGSPQLFRPGFRSKTNTGAVIGAWDEMLRTLARMNKGEGKDYNGGGGGNLCQCSKFCVYIFFSSKIFILKCKSKLFHRFYYCLKFELKWNDTWVSLGYRCKNYYRVIVLVKKKSRVFRSLKVKSSNHIYEKRTNIIWWIRKKETGI